MQLLHVLRNGDELVCAGGFGFSSIDWDVLSSRYDGNAGLLTVSGTVVRPDGQYDSLYWIESLPLSPGDVLFFELSSSGVPTPGSRVHTYEQLEALRIEFASAEKSGEADAARIGPTLVQREGCGLTLRVPCVDFEGTLCDEELRYVLCHGHWMSDYKSDEWRLRLSVDTVETKLSGFWCSHRGGAYVTVSA